MEKSQERLKEGVGKVNEDETFVCDKCGDIKDADFIALIGSDLLCEDCLDKAMKGGKENDN